METIEVMVCPKCGDVDFDGPPPRYYKYCDGCEKDGSGKVKVFRRKFNFGVRNGKIVVEAK